MNELRLIHRRIFRNTIQAFTIMEVMLSVLILGIIAAFVMPNFAMTLQKNYEKDMISKIQLISEANRLYRAQHGEYLPGSGVNLDALNTALKLSIASGSFSVSYSRLSDTSYSISATYTGSNSFTIRFTDDFAANLSTEYEDPCCSSGSCFVVPNCS
jgi:type II secretory pathway pseudopilin PulG